jgi:hypothetical protein
MPSKNDAAMTTTFTDILAALAACGYTPTLNVTDNKCSKIVEAYIKSKKRDIHLVPYHIHHVNATERIISTFKEHFIAGLATVDRRTAPSNCGTNFYNKSNSHSAVFASHAMIPSKSPNEEVNGFLTSTKPPSCH